MSWGFFTAPVSGFSTCPEGPKPLPGAQRRKTCARHRGDLPWSRHRPPVTTAQETPSRSHSPLDCPFCLPELKFISLLLFFFKFSIVEKLQIFQNRDTNAMSPHVPTTSLQQFLFFFSFISAVQHLVFVRYFEADLRYHILPVKISMYVSNR